MNARERYAQSYGDLATTFDVDDRPGRMTLYYEGGLNRFSADVVEEAARHLRATCKRFPSLAEWLEACKLAAARRARSAAPARDGAEPARPATWTSTANIALLRAAMRGLRLADPGVRARALELALAELVVLREQHNGPASVPPARLRAEEDRIAALLVRELAGEASAAERAL